MPVMQVNLPRASSRSRYGNDSDSEDAYVRIPVPLNAGRGGSRRGSAEGTVYNNNFLVPANAGGGRRRAASTSGSPQPIYIVNNVDDDRRSRSRGRRDSSAGSDRSRSTHRTSRYGYDRDDVRREIEYEQRRDQLRSRSRERERRREYERIQDEIDDAKRREKKDRERMEEELEERKRKDAIQRQKIIDDAKLADEKKKREQDEYRKKVLEEEAEKERKKKREKEKQEKEVEEQMRKKFKALGYSDARIEELMKGKKERRPGDPQWAIDLSRPTYIKVNRKYLLPDTLDYYQLPWEWDKNNSEYIVIKRYIDDDFQEVLFEHTRTIKTKRKVITSGYEKDVTVTLRPRQEVTEVVKDRNDNMFLVRSKSRGRERSSSRRRSFIFT